jgi:hypothetical protein
MLARPGKGYIHVSIAEEEVTVVGFFLGYRFFKPNHRALPMVSLAHKAPSYNKKMLLRWSSIKKCL